MSGDKITTQNIFLATIQYVINTHRFRLVDVERQKIISL